jgi:hypothetical protein
MHTNTLAQADRQALPVCYLLLPADAAMLNAMSQLQALVAALPELPDEVQGALAVRVPGLLDTPAAEVRLQLGILTHALFSMLVAFKHDKHADINRVHVGCL